MLVCNESVVISYGIVAAKVQKNPLLPTKVADFFHSKAVFLALDVNVFGHRRYILYNVENLLRGCVGCLSVFPEV
jgi:hypothetical protein